MQVAKLALPLALDLETYKSRRTSSLKDIYVDRTPYFYIIQHIKSGKKYAGCRYGKDCHPDDLLKSYFTSSGVVNELIESEGISSFEIVEVKTDIEDVLEYEMKFLQENDCASSDEWMNLHNAYGSVRWEDLSEESRKRRVEKSSKSHRKTWESKSEEEKEEIKKRQKRWLEDKEKVKARNEKVTKAQRDPKIKRKVMEGRKKAILEKYGVDHQLRVPEIKEKVTKTIEERYGPILGTTKNKSGKYHGPKSDEKKIQLSENQAKTWKERYGVERLSYIRRTCEHCGKETDTGNYHRWHGDRCRYRNKD